MTPEEFSAWMSVRMRMVGYSERVIQIWRERLERRYYDRCLMIQMELFILQAEEGGPCECGGGCGWKSNHAGLHLPTVYAQKIVPAAT